MADGCGAIQILRDPGLDLGFQQVAMYPDIVTLREFGTHLQQFVAAAHRIGWRGADSDPAGIAMPAFD